MKIFFNLDSLFGLLDSLFGLDTSTGICNTMDDHNIKTITTVFGQ